MKIFVAILTKVCFILKIAKKERNSIFVVKEVKKKKKRTKIILAENERKHFFRVF